MKGMQDTLQTLLLLPIAVPILYRATRRPAVALEDNLASLANSKPENAFDIRSTYYRIENDMILDHYHKVHPKSGYRNYNRVFSILEFSIALAALVTITTTRPQTLALLPSYAYWVYLGYIALESSYTTDFNFERIILGTLYLFMVSIISIVNSIIPSTLHEQLLIAFALAYIIPSLFVPYQTDNIATKPLGGPDSPAALDEPKSIFERAAFLYVDPYIFKHFRIPVNNQSQIPSLRSDNLTSYILLKFRSLSSSPPTVTTLIPRLFKCFKADLTYMFLMSTFKSIFTLSAPFCLQRILKHISSRGDGTTDKEAFIFAFLLFAGQIAASLFNQQALLVGRKLCINLRSTLISEVFLKSLRRKFTQGGTKEHSEGQNGEETESKESSDTSSNEGRIINLVSVDAFKTSEISAYLHFLFPECPLTIVLAIVGLYALLGKSALVGISVLLLTFPITYFINRIFIKIQQELLEKIDARLDLATEVLSNIHLVKLNAWEDRLIEKMNITRAKELSVLKKRFAAWIFNGIFMWGTPIGVTVLTFMAHTKIFGQVLTSQEAFTALLLFSILRSPLEALPEVVVHVLQAKISCDRIAEFLNNEVDTSKYQQLSGPKEIGDPTIGFKNATLVYEGDGNIGFALRKLNLDFPVGKFSVIAGPVGSGKTSLLDSLLGELSLVDGRVFMPCTMNAETIIPDEHTGLKDTIAYAPQNPFLLSSTIKENILFGSPFNKKRYEEVLKACALLPDLALFDDGDETEVGEKGTSCSGGQKARISLARAIYSPAKHLLLDDVLSAVDANTGQNLIKNALLGPLMRNRTVILVTHHVAMCAAKASYVVFLRDGLVDGAGTADELRKQGLLDVTHADIEDVPPEEKKEPELHDKRLETVQDGHHLISNNILVEGYATPVSDKRKSTVSINEEIPVSDTTTPKKTLIEEEKKSEGAVSMEVYKLYAVSLGGTIFWLVMFFTFIGAQSSEVGASYSLRLWTSAYDDASTSFNYIVTRTAMLFVPEGDFTTATLTDKHDSTNYYLAIYVLASAGYIMLSSLCMFVMFNASVNASRKLYNRMLTRVMKTRSRFFDSTPTGRIMNRLSKDIEVVDQETAPVVLWFLHSLVLALFILLVIVFAAPAFVFGAIFVAIIYYIIGTLYLQTSRDVKRVESLTRSPIFSTFFECLNGVVSIRAYSATNIFQNRVFQLIDENNAGFLMLWITNRWLSLRIDVAAAFISLTTAIFLLLDKNISPSMAGFALSYAITFNEAALWVVRLSAQTEINLNSVERIGEYLDLEQEQKDDEGDMPGPEWPSEHSYIDIRSLCVRYSPELRRVLDDVSFVVKPGEKVGICGRTGSGKSTLVLCLNRILELESGLISIDGNDISELKLEAIRNRITTIPQEAQLFAGTVRENLDPFDEFNDDEIWEILKRVKLASSLDASMTSLPDSSNVDRTAIKSLGEKVSQNGKNFSAGQRQLLALARGLLKLSHAKSNILLLDESTANLDSHSDEVIQKALRYDMDNVTILCVAHRLRTIADYDKILVLDAGRVVEFDSPANLYRKNANFTALCKQSGEDAELAKIIFGKEK
ncbi:P-loop containing nucleoside triphosphate hydrolase protein [Wallemia mellicola]|nr:P-loop containing nucleoside triphosphate hydrolase protein [Wallemia mellicola]